MSQDDWQKVLRSYRLHTHTHTNRLVRNATNVRSSFVSAEFTARTNATMSNAKPFNKSGAKPPSTCNYTSNKISQGNGGKNLHAVHQTSVGSRSPKKGRITQDCQNLTVLHAYEIGPIKRTQRWALKAHSNTDWVKCTMNLGGVRKLTYCEFTTTITTNRRWRCVSYAHNIRRKHCQNSIVYTLWNSQQERTQRWA